MKQEQILEAMNGLDEETVAEARKPHSSVWKRVTAVAACAVLVAGAVGLMGGLRGNEAVPEAENRAPIAVAEASPDQGRKFLVYNGHQYVFLHGGAAYALTEEQLGQDLGTLEYEIIMGQQDHLKDDYATTFAVGGTVREVNAYNPAFRIAVTLEGQTYLCENVDAIDDSDVDMAVYFADADFANTVTATEIRDHMGRTVLEELNRKDSLELLELLGRVETAQLENEDYERIGKAQKDGKSFFVTFRLSDTTGYDFYLIPELSIAMFGNNRYTLPEDFEQAFGKTFGALKQEPIGIQY